MTAHRSLQACIAGALLLQACAIAPARHDLAVEPAMALRHSANQTADAYYQLGRHHQGQGNLDLALSGYNYAIARDARHLDARIAAAAIHAQQGRLDQARAMMLAVVADYPTHSQSHNNLGYIDYLRGDHAGAAQAMRRALVLDHANERARNNLALAEHALAGTTPPAIPEPVQIATALPKAAAPLRNVDAPSARLELVQVVPHVYELKLPAPRMAMTAAALPLAIPAPATVGAARVEVSNGAGTPGLARRVGAMLGKNGIAVARLTNQRPFGQQTTRIVYRAAHAVQAESLRKLMDGPVEMREMAQMDGASDVRVVLGKDTQRAMAAREANTLVLAQR